MTTWLFPAIVTVMALSAQAAGEAPSPPSSEQAAFMWHIEDPIQAEEKGVRLQPTEEELSPRRRSSGQLKDADSESRLP